MKAKIISLVCVASTAFAADLTITVPDKDVSRVQEAFGAAYNLGHPATTQEVQQAITAWLNQVTTDYERRKFTPASIQFPTTAPAKAAAPTATPKKKK
jgi:hypothetical protein